MRTDHTFFPEPLHDSLAVLEQLANATEIEGLPALPETSLIHATPLSAKIARQESWQPDRRYRSLIEQLPVVTFMAGLDQSVEEMYISPQIEALLGFTPEEWLANPFLWYQQLHPDDREAWVAEFARTCATGAHFRVEYRLIRRDGKVVWVQGECQVIRDDHGRPLFMQGIAVDITYRKQAALVEEARLAAEAANRAKSEFLARMSHEIRTPLNGVVGMIDLLRSTGMTNIQNRYAQLARDSADTLLSVINDVLDFSKIEAGKVEIDAIEFDFHQLVDDLTELLAPVAAKKNLALACLLRPDVPRRVIGDPTKIRQVLTNLINNALKFTVKGYVSIRASLDHRADQGLFVRVQVEDTGIGIPPDRLDRLFKSFSQVDISTTRKYGGTGLGLAISKQLVELMGGEIGIDSEEGRGTTFWFTLKLAQNLNETPGLLLGPAEALQNVRVLAAESDPINRRILSEQLSGRLSSSSVIVPLDQAFDALHRGLLDSSPFEVALVPIDSPAASALAAGIQADAKLRNINLIAVTDVDTQMDDTAVRRAGYFTVLYRPIVQSRLLDAIASATVKRTADKQVACNAAVVSLASLKGLHLLVAEDNEMNQFVTSETLRRVGCTCEIVADGLLALEAMARGKFDGVLMDCQMPRMGGLEASRLIREREAAAGGSRHIPIIALTAEAIQGDREKCLAAGMDGYVTKPINAEDLFAAIGSLMSAGAPAMATLIAPTVDAASGAQEAPATQTPPPVPPLAAPVDVEALMSRCMRDAQFAIKTLEKFHRRATEDVKQIGAGLASGDLAATMRVAHNLNAVAAQVSAKRLGEIASEIEQASVQRDLGLIERQLALLDEEAKRCVSFLPQAIEGIQALTQPIQSSGKGG